MKSGIRSIAWTGLMAVVVACSSTGSGSSTLADYAAGRWSCDFSATTAGEPNAIPITATVSAADAAHGAVVLELPGGDLAPDHGRWSLREGRLVVNWDRKGLGPVQAAPVSLDTGQFRIRGGTNHPTRRGNWVTVTVNREARKVSFAFTMPDHGGPGTLSCRKD